MSVNQNSAKIILHKLRHSGMFYIIPGVILLLFAMYAFYQRDDLRFERLCDDILCETFASDSLSLHFFLKYPEKHHLNKSSPVLPNYSKESDTSQILLRNQQIEELSNISPQNLSEQNHELYCLLLPYLRSESALENFDYFYEPFSPSQGMQTQLPILLAEYRISKESDIDNYFQTLKLLPDYFNSLCDYEDCKASSGKFMSKRSCREVISQCNKIPNIDQIANGEHFLCESFNDRVDVLVNKGTIDNSEALRYKKQNQELLQTYFVPAYSNLSARFSELMKYGNEDCGLCNFENGKEYYEQYLAFVTGSSRSVPEIRSLLQQDFIQTYAEIRSLSQSTSSDFTKDSFTLSSPDEMIDVLKAHTLKDFPALSPEEAEGISCNVKNVYDGMETYLSPAFYLVPPHDDVRENFIYINYARKPDSLTLFTTLAHEGYPGHLYQTVYNNVKSLKQSKPMLKALLNYGGYVEGYATYVENLSYEYAKEYGNADEIELMRLTRNLQLCLYSLMDIAIHYDHMTKEDASMLLLSVGVSDTAVVDNIYCYIASEPANYLKYYLGYLEICDCKKLAQKTWGERYTDQEFHRFFLDYGPADFKSIKDAVVRY